MAAGVTSSSLTGVTDGSTDSLYNRGQLIKPQSKPAGLFIIVTNGSRLGLKHAPANQAWIKSGPLLSARDNSVICHLLHCCYVLVGGNMHKMSAKRRK